MRATLGIVCLSLAACVAGGERVGGLELHSFEAPAMGTIFRCSLYAKGGDEAAAAWEAALARLVEIEKVASDYDAESELRRLCARPAGEWTPISGDLSKLLTRSEELSRMTEGAFDPTVGSYVRLWRRARRNRELPDPERVAEAALSVGAEHVELKEGRARLLVEGMRLDLGAIAKGYALDEALRVLRGHGIDRALFDGGGDVLAGAPPPHVSGWKIAVRPLGPEGPVWAMELHHQAVATSGDASQFVVIDGERYSHLIDPRTGDALRGLRAATVVAPDGATADALASAVCVMGEEGVAMVGLLPRTEACVWGIEFADEGACATPGLGWMMVPPPDDEVMSPRSR